MRPQGILAPPAKAAIFLVLTVRAGAEEDVRDLLSDVAGLTRSVGFRAPEDGLSCVVGIGAEVWSRLYGGRRPAGLHPFRELKGDVHTAPSTPGDLLFHLRAHRLDLCFELARQLMIRLDGLVDVVDEVQGFRYFDERDLLGFVDGTENPDGEAAAAAVTIGAEDPGFAGGSYVIVQKYLHDLGSWEALTVEEQEKAIGRKKLSDIEFPDEDKPADSHVALTTITDPDGTQRQIVQKYLHDLGSWEALTVEEQERAIGRKKLSDIEFPDEDKPADSHVALTTITDPDGTQRQIVRDNMMFGRPGAGEFGTYFIGYASTPDVTERMLENMFLGSPPGNHDRILDFSTAVTGSLFFVPTADFLEGNVPAPGSLGIGSLKRSST